MTTLFEHFYRKKKAQNSVFSTPSLGISDDFSQRQALELVGLYRAIRGMAGGPELEKLKADFESRWGKLAEDKREVLVQKLLEMRLLPEIIGKALNIFNGKVIRLV